FERNGFGHPTLTKDNYTVPIFDGVWPTGWDWALRQNTYTYDANGADLTQHSFEGEVRTVSIYNEFHQLTTTSNALAEATTFKYNSNHQLTNMLTPTGLILTYGYDANGFLSS